MTLDLTKLAFHSGYDMFKNNAIYTGTYTISGSTVAGVNTRSFTVTLGSGSTLTDASFNGPTDPGGTDPRIGSGWFKKGYVWVVGNNSGAGYTNYSTQWAVYSSLNGTTMTVTLLYVQSFSASLTLNGTNMGYRVVDYGISGS